MQAVTLQEDELLFQQEVARFAEATVSPHVSQMDQAGQLLEEIRSACFEMGLMGIEIPQTYGGSGAKFFLTILAVEALAKVDPAVAVFVDVQNTLVNNVFLRWASDDLKQRYFPLLAGESVGAFCLTEPNAGSDAFALTSRARPDGDGFILDGRKCFITNAAEASVFLVFATVNPAAGYKGITTFVVDGTSPGLRLGKKEDKLGIRASSTCEVVLDGVRVGPEQVVGEVGIGYKIAMETLNEGRIGIAAQMLGLAAGALGGALTYAGERRQFSKPIRDFQGVQFQLARMATQVHAARLLVYHAARLKDAGLPFVREAAMAKYYVSELAEKVASAALEIYGGYGFIKEYPAEKFYRDAKIGKLYEGTSNLQLQTIFKHLVAGSL